VNPPQTVEPAPADTPAPTLQAVRTRPSTVRDWLRVNSPTIGPIGALVVLFLVFAVAAGSDFVSKDNMTNILAQCGVIAVMGTGLTFVLLIAEIDLMFSAVAVLAGVSGSIFFSGQKFPLFFFGEVTFGHDHQLIAIVAALIIATLFGLLAGALTSRLGVPSFIATLGLLLLCDGLSFYWSKGNIVYDVPPLASKLGGETLGPIPYIAITAAVIMLIAHIVLSRTRFGRYIYMTGSNRRAAELAGINTRKIILSVFAISGFLAGVAGLLAVGRLGSAQPDASNSYLLPVIAATVVGGVSLFGGVGTIRSTLVGVLVFTVLDNGLDQTNIDIHLKPFMRGLILLLAIVVNVVGLRLASRARTAEQAEVEVTAGPPGAAQPATGTGV
jgi:ribose transport system permease protein